VITMDAGSLYNEHDGKRRYALVDGDRLITWTGDYLAEAPTDTRPYQDGRWLPIEYEDSEPFDPEEHRRQPPAYRVEPERVVGVYQIIPKAAA
jgi:hypothetical protein